MAPEPSPTARARVRSVETLSLTGSELAAIRTLMDEAFAGDDPDEHFTDDDWQHALGGVHVLAELDGRIVAHAAVVLRELHVAGRPLRTGYVEAVATAPALQGRGLGSLVMRPAGDHIRTAYELGALGTGEHGFYARLGWRTWRGPTAVRMPGGEQPTPEDDGYLMVLATATTPASLDLDAPISCEWRPGDVW